MKNTLPPQFLILWIGQLISSIGTGITAFALGIYIFKLTGSATSYSLIILAAFLPTLVLKPFGGTLSDRVDRRLLMIIGDMGSAFGVIFIILMMLFRITDIWVIYLGTIISSIFVALQNPAYKASVTDLVDEKHYAKASGLMQLAESSKFLISPLVAGLLLEVMDILPLLILDAFTFLIAIVTLCWIRPHHSQKKIVDQHFFNDFMEGFQYLFNNKGILWLLVITSVVTFFIGFLQALLGPMILAFSNAQTLGITQTVATTGMLIGSLFIGMAGKSNNKIRILSFSLFCSGIFFSLMGLSTNILIITLFGFLFFLFLPFVNTSLDVLVRSNVDNAIQGRIWSIVSLISQLGMAIAFGIAGFLAEKIFNPLLLPDGILSSTVGALIGTGEGRGIGFIFVISGTLVSLIAVVMSNLKTLKTLENTK